MISKNLKSYYEIHSKFYDQTRWAFLFGRKKLTAFLPDLPDNARILDLGCGTGIHLPTLRKKYPLAEIFGLDLSPDMLLKADDTVAILRNEEYRQTSFAQESLDLILCSYSLSMMNEIKEIITSITHHLNKNGVLLILDFDTTPYKWFAKWMKRNHVYFESELFKKLENQFHIQFKVVKQGYFGLYSYSIFLVKMGDRLP